MTHVGYIAAGWALTFGVCGLYAFWLIGRGRSLSSRVPVARRRWMTTPDETGLNQNSPAEGSTNE